MVELDPNSCRICLATTQPSDRQLLFSEDNTLNNAGLLYVEVLSLPIACENVVLKYICNSCGLELKLFKELKSKALETHELLSNVNINLSEEYHLRNYSESECDDGIQSDIIVEVEEEEYLVTNEPTASDLDDEKNTFEVIENVQYLEEESLIENVDEAQDEEYLFETDDMKWECPTTNNSEQSEVYPCPSCDKTFELKGELNKHKKNIHPKMKKLKCSLCPKTVYSEEALEVHFNLHNGLPAYQCNFCEKNFKQKAHYNYHMLNHRNERNIICEVCHKGYISKSDLKIHMRVHTDERRYKCDICEKLFRAHTHMVNHRYSHFEKQFECPACLQKYVSPNTLRTHFKAVHIGEVPYECEFCEKKFKRKHHLHMHYKTHNKVVEKGVIQNGLKSNDFTS